MVRARFSHLAYICRFGRQSLTEVMGRAPTRLEWALFEAQLTELVNHEYAATPAEMRQEDD